MSILFPRVSWPQHDTPLFSWSMEKQIGVIQAGAGVGGVGLYEEAFIPVKYTPLIIHKICKSGPNY